MRLWMHGICAAIFGLAASAATVDTPAGLPHVTAFATTAPAPLKGMAVDGAVYALADANGLRASGVVFLSTTCPISNKYVPELNRMAEQLHQKHGDAVRLLGVISDPTVTRAAAAKYVADYHITFPMLFDASGELARRLKPQTTPEAFALDAEGHVKYRGRIDDTFIDLRKQKLAAASHELADALEAVAKGEQPAVASVPAVGCIFEAWDAKAKDAKVTYARDVAPILNANCVQCHRAGEVAPFALTSYEDAAKHAKQMARVTDERLMPPWKAEPGYGHFIDERRLSDGEIDLIARWAKAGAPKGDDADLPPAPKFTGGWLLGQPDVVVEMPKAFTVPASGRDVYRVFPLPVNIPDNEYVVGFEFKPGATTVVHHALLFLDDNGRARELEAKNNDGQPGYRSFGGLGFQPSGGLGGWAPGAMPSFLPDDVGKPMHKGTDVIIQVHYHPDGKEHQDRSRLALYFAKKPMKQVAVSFPLANNRIDIQPGDSHYVLTKSITTPRDVTLIGIIPHMHLVGRQMKVTATEPDGTVVPLIWVKDWDFRWQDQYRYAEPIHLPKGTTVSLEAVYDNSASNPDNPNNPPKRVRRGEQTTDEMCICFLQMAIDRPLFAPGSGTRGPLLQWLLGARRASSTQPAAKE
jgi:mono/diheme cytochrome c family protein